MRVHMTFDFDDEYRAAIARYLHLRYDAPPRKLATREQLRGYVYEGLGNMDIAIDDTLATEQENKDRGINP